MKAELKKDILSIWKIFHLAKQSFQYSNYLHSPDTEEETTEINRNHFLRFISHIILRVLVIELCKLYNNDNSNQKFSIPKLLKKLKNDGHYSKLNFNKEKLGEWVSKLQSLERTVININVLRDKLYAHTDRQKPDLEQYGFEFEELEILLELTEDIIYNINSDLFDTHTDLRTEFDMCEMDIVKNIVDFKEYELQKSWNQFRSRRNTNS
ncbi:hypothetical protein [uncultured Pontibacter sp.]|uniref:AbiU2 domain-containing protein n=1 Tax=uncultured Pontibacter sp. TaxID=453356 RepID=UPI002603A335|nr:hypothetical protein [uncultured Pontibacter sp.]